MVDALGRSCRRSARYGRGGDGARRLADRVRRSQERDPGRVRDETQHGSRLRPRRRCTACIGFFPRAAGTTVPGRMAGTSALSFVFSGTSLLLLWRWPRALVIGQALTLLTVIITTLALVGYAFSAPDLSGAGGASPA